MQKNQGCNIMVKKFKKKKKKKKKKSGGLVLHNHSFFILQKFTECVSDFILPEYLLDLF